MIADLVLTLCERGDGSRFFVLTVYERGDDSRFSFD